jgi:predicted metal-dependent hydrolase
MIKILKLPHHATTNMDLYNSFIKNLHKVSERVESDPVLLESFNRVNERYFNALMEAPNLVWGSDSRRRLATYDYHTDTVKVSTFFRNARQEIIDYLVYHELLHKKLKFNNSGSRSIHHSAEFRRLEGEFDNSAQLEKEIASMLRSRQFFGLRF